MKKLLVWIIWSAALLFYAYTAGFMMPKAHNALLEVATDPGCVDPPDLIIMRITEQRLLQNFSCMGDSGLDAYLEIETYYDLIYIFSYGLFYCLTLFFVIRYAVEEKRLAWSLALLPIIVAVADLYENFNLIKLVGQYPDLDHDLVVRASTGNIWKWLFALFNFMALFFFGIKALVALRHKHK
jgi:hypothetical protein